MTVNKWIKRQIIICKWLNRHTPTMVRWSERVASERASGPKRTRTWNQFAANTNQLKSFSSRSHDYTWNCDFNFYYRPARTVTHKWMGARAHVCDLTSDRRVYKAAYESRQIDSNKKWDDNNNNDSSGSSSTETSERKNIWKTWARQLYESSSSLKSLPPSPPPLLSQPITTTINIRSKRIEAKKNTHWLRRPKEKQQIIKKKRPNKNIDTPKSYIVLAQYHIISCVLLSANIF